MADITTRHATRNTHPAAEAVFWLIWRTSALPVSIVPILFRVACALCAPVIGPWPGRAATRVHRASSATAAALVTAARDLASGLARRPTTPYVAAVAAVCLFAVVVGLIAH